MSNITVNKVVLGNETLLDLTSDTVTPATLTLGYTAHDASGAAIVGTSTGGSMVIRDESDIHGGTIRYITAGSVVTGTISISENGTYDVSSYADASVSVESEFFLVNIVQNQYDDWVPEQTMAAISAAYASGQDIVFTTDQQYGMCTGRYDDNGSEDPFLEYYIIEPYYDSATGAGGVSESFYTYTEEDGAVLNSVTEYYYIGNATATASDVLSGKTFFGSEGLKAGTIASRSSSDLTVSGATVTVPAGHYSQSASKSVASGSATTPATSFTATPMIAVNSSGLITATVSGSKSVTPTVSAGYVSSGTAGTVSVSGSNTSQLSTQAAATITPSTSQQTAVAAGKYTTGNVVVSAMPSGTAGTPTATKGSVSNHSISVTPSVTNTTGYITGSTKTGTAVTVTASELVSGTKSITANGTGIDVTNYASVDVSVPSGSSTLITKSITANGTYNASDDSADGYSSVTVNVPSGGGGSGSMADPIRFFDYDGTLVASYTSVPSSLPSVPSHTGLTGGTWNYTLAQITTQFNAMGACDVGANYTTVSGATEIDIVLPEGRLHPYLSLAVNGTVSIDWGDGSTPSTSTGTSLTTRKNDIHHVYAAAGSYTIKITKTSGTGYSLYCTNSYALLNKNSSTSNENRVYADCVVAVRIGADCTIGNYAFQNCYSLKSVTIPSNIASVGNYAFSQCYSLTSVTIPSGVTIINSNTFSQCCALASVSFPSSVTSLGTNVFQYCYALPSVSIPSGITSISAYEFYCHYSLASITFPSDLTSVGNYAFYNCYSLASVTIPSDVTTIGTYAFYNCYGLAEFHLLPTTPPTLGTEVFTHIPSDCVIYVPTASLSDYQTANNWSNYASYMVGE